MQTHNFHAGETQWCADHSPSPVLITSALFNVDDLYDALARALRRPRSLDLTAPASHEDMVELLRQTRVRAIICSHWSLDDDATQSVIAALEPVDVALVR